MTRHVGTSRIEHDGIITAHGEGDTFSGADLRKLSPDRRCYVLTFAEQDEDDTVTLYAITDEDAEEYAREKFIPPFTITERITTWRTVAEIA